MKVEMIKDDAATGKYICAVCEREGKRGAERFITADDEQGKELMQRHVILDHDDHRSEVDYDTRVIGVLTEYFEGGVQVKYINEQLRTWDDESLRMFAAHLKELYTMASVAWETVATQQKDT